MNIQTAAQFLGVSVKSVERHVKSKKIAVTYVEGRRDFDKDELIRFKGQKLEPLYRPAITATQNDTALSQSVAPEYLGEGLEYIEALAQSSACIAQHYKLAAIRSKMVLTLTEAAALSGLSKGFLNKHLNASNLSGKKIGKGWKIRPTHLEEFIDALFAGLYKEVDT
ncbi:MAG: helix-turn-helix domain-containing protein [Nostoc sp.]|uniref:helix-turn-helix domain-containing protein n=1 Tax=Nostoc sp. TaxID=1180 RepID=UPI002FFD207D